MDDRRFMREVAETLACDDARAEGLTLAVFQVLRDRLTVKEAADVAAQMPIPLKRLWNAGEHVGRHVEKLHEQEFLGRVRRFAGLPDDAEAARAVTGVFRALQHLLGSANGRDARRGRCSASCRRT
jgi:uncharacterized protein (DUF2267 family)